MLNYQRVSEVSESMSEVYLVGGAITIWNNDGVRQWEG